MLKYALPLAFAVRPTAVYTLLRRKLNEIIPLNQLLGLEIVSIADGAAEARLGFRPELANHIGSMHATAIFGLAEAASGAAMSGAFAPVAMSIRPVAASATISFLKLARGGLRAYARTAEASEELRARLARDHKVRFDVRVRVVDENDAEVGEMTVAWHVAQK